ncbi:MAG: XisI protein [Polyangiales bacterium]
MDPVEGYREALMRVLRAWERRPGPESALRFEAVFDRERDRYLLVVVGWDGRHHVHATLAHVDVVDGKLWIQHDQTESGVAPDLVDAGVPRDRIVLAFKSPARRALTGYAVS